jgi:hypothetical protein
VCDAWSKGDKEAMLFKGYNSNARGKEGVCYRHYEKSGINTNNNSTLVTSAYVTPPIPPHQSIDYEDEEELNIGFGSLEQFQGIM